jgi:chaperonin GroES
MAKKVSIDKILSNPTNVVRLLDENLLGCMYDYCDVRYKDLVATRTPRNEKLKEANEEALQVYKQKDFPWPKAASVKYPLITNACIDFASRIYPAVWQDGDVAKTKFYSDHKDYEAGKRISNYLNYCLAEKIPGWSQNLDKLTTALPINGLMLKKVYYDPEIMTVRSELVFPQDLFVPGDASELSDAPYYFHRYTRTRRDIISYLRSGLWDGAIEDEFKEEEIDDGSKATNASVRPEDAQTTVFADMFEIVEGYICWDLDGDGFDEPYIVTFIPKVSKVVRVVPRYDEDSILKNSSTGAIYRIKPQEFFVEYPFMQSPDGSLYALGLGELLLSINQAVDTSINQLLDAGTLNNMSSGWVSNTLRGQKGTTSFSPGEWKPVNSFAGKLSDHIVPMPKSEPSQTTFALMQTLIDAGAQIAGAQQIKDVQIPSNLSATSSMAIIENGMTGLKSVYKRFHRSLTQELRLILHWLAKYPDILEYQSIAGQGASINDFNLIDMITPVSDPNLITTISKATKAQQLLDMANQGLIDKGLASIQICDFAGIDPSTVTQKEMSPMDKIAMQTATAQLDLIKAQTFQALALALRAKDQGIGDLYRADTEGVARAGKAMADIKNAMTFKEPVQIGDKVTTKDVFKPDVFAKQVQAIAESVGISFQTPVGRLLGDKLAQSIPEGIQGVEDTQPNDVSAALSDTIIDGDGTKL